MEKIKQILGKEQNKLTQWGIGVIFGTLAVVVWGICILQGLGEDIWFDEVFSVRFSEHGYGEIAALTAQDVHPPLYYWYLKLFCEIGQLLFPSVSRIVLCKMASMLPFAGIFLYAATLLRKRFGGKTMGIFLFLIAAMPQISNYTVEIRMYSLALFLITAIFLHAYELIQKEQRRGVHWAAFCLYGILTAYTQYYACAAVIAVYIALFVYFLLEKEKRSIRLLFICAGISVVMYLPWLPILFAQFTAVSSSYWILPLTWRSIFGCVKYIFLPVSFAVVKNYILAVSMIVIFGSAVLYVFFKTKDRKKRFLIACGIFIPVFTALVGFVCSALGRPIFVYRYLLPCLGAMWLVAAVVLGSSFSKNLVLVLLLPFLLAGHANMEGFYNEEHKKIVEMEATETFLEQFSEDAVVICNFNHVQALSAFYLADSNPVYLYGGQPEALIGKLLPNCKGLEDAEQLPLLLNDKEVYFFGSFNSREDLLAEWQTKGINASLEGTYLLERYYFNVYRLDREKK